MVQIDWQSAATHVLANPRLPKEDLEGTVAKLQQLGDFGGHLWLATSGSSGILKWAALSKQAILASAEAVNEFLASTSQDVWVNPLPPFHVGGLGIRARCYLSRAKIIDYYGLSQGHWDCELYYELLCNQKGTLTSLVPTQVFDLVVKKLSAPPSLRGAVVGGGALAAELYMEATALGWKLLPSYGLTECASQVATAKQGGLDSLQLLPHIEIAITDEGAIAIKSPSLLTAYAFATTRGIKIEDPKRDGWFLTEDLGELHGRSLKIKGRATNFVKIGGESVDMNRLEKILEEIKLSLSFKGDAVLAAVPDPRLGHVVHLAASIVHTVQELIIHFNKKVQPFEKIRKVHHFDEIPRSPLGKVQNSALLKTILSQDLQASGKILSLS